jgi:hypothetical protein
MTEEIDILFSIMLGMYYFVGTLILPNTSSKSRRRVRRALTRAHVSMTSGYVTLHGGWGAAIPPVVSTPASYLRVALESLCVLWLQHPSPDSGQLRSRYCPMKLYKIWAIEVNKYSLTT